ncbi:hypothetical protein [Ascidiaceihabitans sp.]|uniref:hypothetical protein n=1 Tax=Ascidiaceihabitans sp. TaxID=1872644 RepID=UPI0032969A65
MLSYYKIQPGDQLDRILIEHYGRTAVYTDYQSLIGRLRPLNPQIKNLDVIYSGDVIMLPDLQSVSDESLAKNAGVMSSSKQIATRIQVVDSSSAAFISGLNVQKFLSKSGEGFVGMVEKATKDAVPDAKRIVLDYYRKDAGTISTNQYNYSRAKSVRAIDGKLGPLHQLINPGMKPREVLRIKPHDAIRTNQVLTEVDQLSRISKHARLGGRIIKAAGWVDAGARVHFADSNQERTVIVMDEAGATAGAIAGGAAASLVLTTLLVSNPAGWVVLTVALAGAVAGSYAGEAASKAVQNEVLFDAAGNRVNTKADKFWEALY